MLFPIAGFLIALAVTWWFIYPTMFSAEVMKVMPKDPVFFVVSLILFGMIVGLCGLLGGVVGWLLAFAVGACFPQKYEEKIYEVRSLRESSSTNLMPMIMMAGKIPVTVLVPFTTTTYKYIYRQGQGQWTSGEVDSSYVTILEKKRLGIELTIRAWWFRWIWVKYVARPKATEYEFHVPHRTQDTTITIVVQ